MNRSNYSSLHLDTNQDKRTTLNYYFSAFYSHNRNFNKDHISYPIIQRCNNPRKLQRPVNNPNEIIL
jgi:hypothetical protein